jgi:hypothetical protein
MSTASLMQILRFTDEDLTYNRRGEFSPRQIAEEQANVQGCRRASCSFVLIAMAVVVLGIVAGSELMQRLSVPLGILGLLAAGAFFLTYSKSSLKVATTSGEAKLTMDRGGGAPYHVLIIGGTYFRISFAAYNQIEEGATYSVYYIPMQRNQILSIERIESKMV